MRCAGSDWKLYYIHQEDGILSGFGLGDNPSGCPFTRWVRAFYHLKGSVNRDPQIDSQSLLFWGFCQCFYKLEIEWNVNFLAAVTSNLFCLSQWHLDSEDYEVLYMHGLICLYQFICQYSWNIKVKISWIFFKHLCLSFLNTI